MASIAQMIEDRAALEEMQRQERIRSAWQVYYGQMEKPLKVKPGNPDDNVRLNFARLIVDVGVSFLFGDDLAYELKRGATGVTDTKERSAPELWLDAVWAANRQATLLHKLAVNGGVAGHAFLKIQLRTPDFPRLVVLDPATVSVKWEPDDYENVVEYKIQWHGVDPKNGKAKAFRQLITSDGGGWTITDQVSEGDIPAWLTLNSERWPWAWPPIIDCQNLPAPNEYYGVSDLEEDITGVMGSLNFLLSNANKIVRHHAHPKTYAVGVGEKDKLNVGIDDLLKFGNPQAKLASLEMQSDLGSTIELYKRQKEALHEIARIPEIATGRVEDVGALSGVALEILYQPLLEKTRTKRLLYGDLLNDLNRRLLEMGGYGNENVTVLQWPRLLPRDNQAEAQAAVLWEQAGYSQATMIERSGGDPESERKKRNEEQDDAAERQARVFDQGGAE